MRVFYLTTEFLWPPSSGGRVRSLAQLGLLSSLPEVSHVTALCLTEDPVAAADRAALAAALPRVELLPPVPHPIHIRRRPLWLARTAALRLWRGLPYLAGKWYSGRITAALRRAITGGRYDLFYVDHLGMALYQPELRALCPWARLVLEEHNVESDFFGQFAQGFAVTDPRRLLAEAEWQAARRFEEQALQRADAVVAISDSDAQALRDLSGVTPQVVPQVVSFTRRPRHESADAAPRLAYLGNLSWHPNVEGLDWLCQEVWPLLRRRLPQATLTIAGSGLASAGGQPQVPAAWRVPGVTTVGYVADPEDLYRDAVAVVAPVLSGSGVRIKLLESLRAGMPTVTTPMGASGLPLRDGRELLIAGRDPQAFADATVRLCADPELRQRLRQGGYQYLERHHSPAVAAAAMRQALGLPALPS